MLFGELVKMLFPNTLDNNNTKVDIKMQKNIKLLKEMTLI